MDAVAAGWWKSQKRWGWTIPGQLAQVELATISASATTLGHGQAHPARGGQAPRQSPRVLVH